MENAEERGNVPEHVRVHREKFLARYGRRSPHGEEMPPPAKKRSDAGSAPRLSFDLDAELAARVRATMAQWGQRPSVFFTRILRAWLSLDERERDRIFREEGRK